MGKAKSAEELADLIKENELKSKQRAYDSLRDKCEKATKDMVKNVKSQEIVDVDEEELQALTSVTEEMRELGYKFKFIERQNSKGEFVSNKLLISVNHLL